MSGAAASGNGAAVEMPKRRRSQQQPAEQAELAQQPTIKPRRQRAATHLRPEAASAQLSETRATEVGECAFYARPGEAARYDAVAKDTRVQEELTLECLDLLALDRRHGPQLVLDVGCGGGLSSDVVQRAGHFCLACDVNPQMIAQGTRAAGVGMFAADMRDGVAARAGVFDGAISVSALQWICTASDADDGLRRFFSGLHRALAEGGRAVLQFYPTRDQAKMAVKAARRSGFRGGCELVVSMPHATRARKHFLVLTKTADAAADGGKGAKKRRRCCPLAWPIDGAVCKIAWLAAAGGGANDPACARLKKAHGEYLERLKRQARPSPRGRANESGLPLAVESGGSLVYSYRRRSLLEADRLVRQSGAGGTAAARIDLPAQKKPHLASALRRLASLSASELQASVAEELAYATGLRCFELSARLGMRRCEVCGINLREGAQWEEHVSGQRHELAVAERKHALKAAMKGRLAALRG